MLFGYLYNDRKGGDISWVLRNLINAFGILSCASGAMEVALQSSIGLDMRLWLLVIWAAIGTTMHTQDMYDQAEDAAAGRRTIPLVYGDGPARWIISFAVSAWSLLCPMFWGLGIAGFWAPVALGGCVSGRCIQKRSVREDRTTFRIYNVWLVSIYSLPLIHCLVSS